MTIKTLAAKGQSNRAIARQLDLCEGTVRYHPSTDRCRRLDGRSRRRRCAELYRNAIDHWIAGHGELSNLAALHDWLVAEHDYSGKPALGAAVRSRRLSGRRFYPAGRDPSCGAHG